VLYEFEGLREQLFFWSPTSPNLSLSRIRCGEGARTRSEAGGFGFTNRHFFSHFGCSSGEIDRTLKQHHSEQTFFRLQKETEEMQRRIDLFVREICPKFISGPQLERHEA
jgi:hypothetical protein